MPSQGRTKAAVAMKSRQELIPLGACSVMSGQASRTIGKGKLRCGRSCCGLGSVCVCGSERGSVVALVFVGRPSSDSGIGLWVEFCMCRSLWLSLPLILV